MQPSSSERLKLIRKESGDISQQKLANAIDIPVNRIKDIESGKYNITVELALKLEVFCNYDFKWIMTGEGNPYGYKNNLEVPKPSNVVELQHMELVREFNDKDKAKAINSLLVKLERVSPEAFDKVGSYIEGVVEGLQMVAEKGPKYSSNREDSDAYDSTIDRRTGKEDRRKSGT